MTISVLPTHPGSAMLRGRSLRFVLVDELMSRGEATVAELAIAVADQGYRLPGRASKIISDALRWEIRRGRVTRPRRACYRYRTAPRSTARRIRTFAARCHVAIVALTRGEDPPPTPPDPRAPAGRPWPTTHDPPWEHLGWLWVT